MLQTETEGKMRKRDLYDNAILIAPPSMKRALLSYRAEYPEQNFSIYSVEEIESAFSCHHDDRLIIDLIQKGYGYLQATEIADVLDHMAKKEKGYSSKKLRDLQPFFDESTQNGHLFRIEYPEKTFGNRQYVVLGYYDGKRISEALSSMPNIGLLWDGMTPPREGKVELHSFPDVHGEFHYVCNRVAKLIDDGVNPEDIYLIGLDEASYFEFSLMAESYGFGIATPSTLTLRETDLGIRFLQSFGDNGDLERALLESKDDSDSYQSLYLAVKTYFIPGLTKQKQLDVYEGLLSSIKVPGKKKKGAVQISSSRYLPQGSHAFLMSFALGKCPRIHRDNEYLSDKEKKELGMPTSIEMNLRDEREVLGLLRRPEVEAVTYAARRGEETLYPSPLLDNKEANISLAGDNDLPYEYSKGFASLWLSSLLDRERKYSSFDPKTAELSKHVDPAYLTYNPQFVSFDAIKNPSFTHLSASSVTDFYKCPFSYYCKKVLCIDDSELPFNATIGTLFHNALEDIYVNGTDPRAALDAELAKENAPFSEMERLLLHRLCERFLVIVDFLKENEARMVNPKFLCERQLQYRLSPRRQIVGRADKIILLGKEQENIAIVDYKTGDTKFNELELPIGLSMQLPTYDLLRHGDEQLRQKDLTGLFISPILPSISSRSDKKSEEETLRNSARIAGIFTGDRSRLDNIDPAYLSPSYIKGLAVTKDNQLAKSKNIKSDEEFAAYLELTKKNYEGAFERIENAEFPISPLSINGENRACKYCPFADVCFHTPKMIREMHIEGLKEEKEEEDDG